MSEATQHIAVLSDEEIEAIEAEIAHLPDRESAAIEALQIVQAKRGWISDPSLAAIARLLGMSPAALDSIATFYNLIFRQPVGRHVIMLCDSVSCYVMGCEKIHRAIAEHLEIRPGETTKDGRFTLLPTVCLGACDKAPVAMIEDDLIGEISLGNFKSVLERYP